MPCLGELAVHALSKEAELRLTLLHCLIVSFAPCLIFKLIVPRGLCQLNSYGIQTMVSAYPAWCS